MVHGSAIHHSHAWHSARQVLQFCLFFPASSVHAWITHLMLDDRRKDIGDLYFLQRVMETARWGC